MNISEQISIWAWRRSLLFQRQSFEISACCFISENEIEREREECSSVHVILCDLKRSGWNVLSTAGSNNATNLSYQASGMILTENHLCLLKIVWGTHARSSTDFGWTGISWINTYFVRSCVCGKKLFSIICQPLPSLLQPEFECFDSSKFYAQLKLAIFFCILTPPPISFRTIDIMLWYLILFPISLLSSYVLGMKGAVKGTCANGFATRNFFVDF